MRPCAFLPALILVPTLAAADMPRAGSCHVIDAAPGLDLAATWEGDSAKVTAYAMEQPARVTGLRLHDDGFKMSFLSEDGIIGPTEIVLFSMTTPRGKIYRMGVVSYDDLADGSRVVSTMTGFNEATCELTM